MPERTTTREQWDEIADQFAIILEKRGIPFSDACLEMGYGRKQYHRLSRNLKSAKRSRPHSQKIINTIQEWNEIHSVNGKKPLRRSNKPKRK